MTKHTGQTTRMLTDIIGCTRIDRRVEVMVLAHTSCYARDLCAKCCHILTALDIRFEGPPQYTTIILKGSRNRIHFKSMDPSQDFRGYAPTHVLVDGSCHAVEETMTLHQRDQWITLLDKLYKKAEEANGFTPIPEIVSPRNTFWGWLTTQLKKALPHC